MLTDPHELALAHIRELRQALNALDVKDPVFASLGEYHARRLDNIMSDVMQHQEREK